MQFDKTIIRLAGVFFVVALASGCAGLQVSQYAYDDSYRVNEPKKGKQCYDASVLLEVDQKKAMNISKEVLSELDSTLTEASENHLEAQRNRHIGLFVGSGGEELFITLKGLGNGRTFVAVTTKTGFVGGAGQEAWSCKIVDQIVKKASSKT